MVKGFEPAEGAEVPLPPGDHVPARRGGEVLAAGHAATRQVVGVGERAADTDDHGAMS